MSPERAAGAPRSLSNRTAYTQRCWCHRCRITTRLLQGRGGRRGSGSRSSSRSAKWQWHAKMQYFLPSTFIVHRAPAVRAQGKGPASTSDVISKRSVLEMVAHAQLYILKKASLSGSRRGHRLVALFRRTRHNSGRCRGLYPAEEAPTRWASQPRLVEAS